jgi:hypothetical protein
MQMYGKGAWSWSETNRWDCCATCGRSLTGGRAHTYAHGVLGNSMEIDTL